MNCMNGSYSSLCFLVFHMVKRARALPRDKEKTSLSCDGWLCPSLSQLRHFLSIILHFTFSRAVFKVPYNINGVLKNFTFIRVQQFLQFILCNALLICSLVITFEWLIINLETALIRFLWLKKAFRSCAHIKKDFIRLILM